MAGYLNETDFVMVEEGFSTRDLLEELTLGASQATMVRGCEFRLGPLFPVQAQLPPLKGPLGSLTLFFHLVFGIQSLPFARLGLILSPVPGPCP